MVHHNVVVMHFRRDVIGHIDCERYRDLGLKSLINVAVRDPNHFSIGVVVSRQYVRNVHDLAALIYQFAAQHFLPRASVSSFCWLTSITGSALAGTSTAFASMRTLFT